jgi:hypothetical protein
MRKIIALAAALAAAGCAREQVEPAANDEARLAAELRDYEEAGPPVSCVPMRNLQGNRSVGEGAIVFGGVGGRIWLNRPRDGCPSIDSGRSLQTRTTSTNLCRGDIATVFDPVSGAQYGSCGLGDFQPYRRRK